MRTVHDPVSSRGCRPVQQNINGLVVEFPRGVLFFEEEEDRSYFAPINCG